MWILYISISEITNKAQWTVSLYVHTVKSGYSGTISDSGWDESLKMQNCSPIVAYFGVKTGGFDWTARCICKFTRMIMFAADSQISTFLNFCCIFSQAVAENEAIIIIITAKSRRRNAVSWRRPVRRKNANFCSRTAFRRCSIWPRNGRPKSWPSSWWNGAAVRRSVFPSRFRSGFCIGRFPGMRTGSNSTVATISAARPTPTSNSRRRSPRAFDCSTPAPSPIFCRLVS